MKTLTQTLKGYTKQVNEYVKYIHSEGKELFYTTEFIQLSVKIGYDFKRYVKAQLDNLTGEAREKFIYRVVHKHIYRKNKKLGTDTLVFNTGSATNCPSIKLGKCQAGNACYALKNEKFRKHSLAYRERQRHLWTLITPNEFAGAILSKKYQHKPTHFRYSESGDVVSQAQTEWLSEVCRLLREGGYVTFGYTARTDMKLDNLASNSIINASNTLDNYNEKIMNRFKLYMSLSDIPSNIPVCNCSLDSEASCANCNLCKKLTGTIGVVIHN
jgi:hypothetical protein